MSEERKRPTREAAMEAANKVTIESRGGSWPNPAVVDAVAALFGGFAPSVVEVPALCSSVGGRHGQVIAARVPTGAIGYGLDERQAVAIAARSNAWEELKSIISSALSTDGQNLTYFRDLMSIMDRPEMGIGPKGKP